ncbi:MAG: 3-oxoacyl-ACP synthase [Alphaproteobacteria bacterium BRH_c36]|nr:MAG: 3-oxoacyl-ACP synthase [Alphaproteobacteria bacterium BRH_c36]
MDGVGLLGLGHYAPPRVVTNDEIEKQLGLEAGFIEKRTGIRERRWAGEGEKLSDMAVAAGEMALSAAGTDFKDVGLVLLATSTPDHLLPPSAPLVAHRLGLTNSGGIDLAGACAGFLYALALGDSFARTYRAKVLVIAANILSRRINMKEMASAVLFADAAGAVLLGPTGRAGTGVRAADLRSEGSGYDLIKIAAGGSAMPYAPGLPPDDVLMSMADGRAVFQKAVGMMSDSSRSALDGAGLGPADVTHFVPHQANSRIIEAVRKDLGIAKASVMSTIEGFANSSAATIPFTLSYLSEARGFQPGDRVLMCAAGAGLNGGAIVLGL